MYWFDCILVGLQIQQLTLFIEMVIPAVFSPRFKEREVQAKIEEEKKKKRRRNRNDDEATDTKFTKDEILDGNSFETLSFKALTVLLTVVIICNDLNLFGHGRLFCSCLLVITQVWRTTTSC